MYISGCLTRVLFTPVVFKAQQSFEMTRRRGPGPKPGATSVRVSVLCSRTGFGGAPALVPFFRKGRVCTSWEYPVIAGHCLQSPCRQGFCVREKSLLGEGWPSIPSLSQSPSWQRTTYYFQRVAACTGDVIGAIMFSPDVTDGLKSFCPGLLHSTHLRRAASLTKPVEAVQPNAVPSRPPLCLHSTQPLSPTAVRLFPVFIACPPSHWTLSSMRPFRSLMYTTPVGQPYAWCIRIWNG